MSDAVYILLYVFKAWNSVETVEGSLIISCFICYEAEMSDSIATNIGDTYWIVIVFRMSDDIVRE